MEETPRNPVPSRLELQQWATELHAALSAGEVSTEYLVDVLAQHRRVARDLGGLCDWLLVAAREGGATLPPLAGAWSSSGNPKIVHGPDRRLKKLTDLVGDADTVLARFLALPTGPVEHPPSGDQRE